MTVSHIIIFLLLVTSVIASDLSAKYKVSFGIFGEIGIAQTSLHVDKNRNYRIQVHASTTGFAKLLSGNREEWYVSVGKLNDKGVLVPDYYEKTVQRNSHHEGELILKKDIKKYIFSHDIKKLRLEQTKYRDKKEYKESKEGDYYASNDLLSLFFNLKQMLPTLEIKKPLIFYAVGANRTDGRIDVEPLENASEIKKEFQWLDGYMMKVIVNDDIFSSDKGELLINLREDGLCQQAVLKDVFLFGDIRGEMID